LTGSIIGILLAAGSSQRFGTDKLTQVLPDGDLVAVQACRHLLAGTDGVIAVVRPGNPILAAELRNVGADVLVCENAIAGMGISLTCGIQASADAAGWLVALADMPWIKPATIQAIANLIRQGTMIAAPSWQGKRGHPVGFARVLGLELSALSGDAGAKSVIQAHREQLSVFDCNDPGVLWDIDKPEDLFNSKPSH
jgi:molybdenum cofactor cytidylyltransferase